MRVLLTGGCGFIGHHLAEHILKNTDWSIVVLDSLNYASSGFDRLRDIQVFEDRRVLILTTDITKAIDRGMSKEIGQVDYIFHLAAETHVDRSIENPEPFVMANVVGTMHMLNFARTLKNLKKFFYFSTDEVFGPAPAGVAYREWDRYQSGNPYAATKAGGEELTLAYGNTYGLPVVITHCMNVFGERQHPEKFIPLTIKKLLSGQKLIVHADSTRTIPGSRHWIHARNVASAVLFLSENAKIQDKYNIVGEREVDNLSLAKLIAKILDKPLHYELVDFHSSRPGHDLRYALSGEKMCALGWQAPIHFEQSLEKTINWYLKYPHWLYEGASPSVWQEHGPAGFA